MTGRMTAWSRTPCTSKFTPVRRRQKPHSPSMHHHSGFLCLQKCPEKDHTSCYVLWVSVSVFVGNSFVISEVCNSLILCLFSNSIFGTVLILVDFVLVVVDISLYDRSREVGDALEAVSLLISFFFLADVLLRVYVEG